MLLWITLYSKAKREMRKQMKQQVSMASGQDSYITDMPVVKGGARSAEAPSMVPKSHNIQNGQQFWTCFVNHNFERNIIRLQCL